MFPQVESQQASEATHAPESGWRGGRTGGSSGSTRAIGLEDKDAEIEPVPVESGGHKPEVELDKLSNILKSFNELFGNIPWDDADRVRRLITEENPARVAADAAFTNARQNSDRQNAKIEHDKALMRVMTSILKDDTQLFKHFMDNESFKRWLTDSVFGMTYPAAG